MLAEEFPARSRRHLPLSQRIPPSGLPAGKGRRGEWQRVASAPPHSIRLQTTAHRLSRIVNPHQLIDTIVISATWEIVLSPILTRYLCFISWPLRRHSTSGSGRKSETSCNPLSSPSKWRRFV